MRLTLTPQQFSFQLGIPSLTGLVRNFTGWIRNKPAYNQLPAERYSKAIRNPWFRKQLIECSIEEDEQNSYYNGILNIIAEHCCGSVPLVIGDHQINQVNDEIEDRWVAWAKANSVGQTIRQIRRSAARTGIGIAIPYKKLDSADSVKLAFKTLCATDLVNPRERDPEARIFDGIEYDENWDVKKIYVNNGTSDPKEYPIEEIIVWYKQTKEGLRVMGPECGPAFTLFPSVKRYMEAIVKAEEFRSSMPMALELDPEVYKPSDPDAVPEGKYEYDPGMVPTLPPGTKLSGIPISIGGEERTKFIQLVIGAAARCVQMPMNLALGDSSNHNMASSQFDMQPWVNRVKIDRCDFEPVTRKIFNMWANRAVLIEDYLSNQTRRNMKKFTYSLNYDSIFQHPDPNKNASSRMADLLSGSTTLQRIYKDLGLNARRELTREAQLYGITLNEYMEILLAVRTPETLKILGIINDQNQEDNQAGKNAA